MLASPGSHTVATRASRPANSSAARRIAVWATAEPSYAIRTGGFPPIRADSGDLCPLEPGTVGSEPVDGDHIHRQQRDGEEWRGRDVDHLGNRVQRQDEHACPARELVLREDPEA